jgi:CRP-like cAMP-binding protein
VGLLSRIFGLSNKKALQHTLDQDAFNQEKEGMLTSTDRNSVIEKEFLKKVNILADLTDEELNLVWSIVKRVEVPADTIILKEGELGDSMYFFVKGIANVTKSLTLKLNKASFGNVEKSMNKLDSAYVSFFGDMALFEDEPRSASITTATDCLLYEIKREEFTNLCDNYPLLGIKILRKIAIGLCGRIRRANQDVLKLSTALSIALSK